VAERKRQFFKLYHDNLGYYLKHLDGNTYKVISCLLMHRNRETGLCCPGWETIQNETTLSSATVRDALNKLESQGLIEREHVPIKRGRYRNVYRINDTLLTSESEVKLTSEIEVKGARLNFGIRSVKREKKEREKDRERETEYNHEGTSTDDEIEWDD